jgi:CRISPR-associated protein Cst1
MKQTYSSINYGWLTEPTGDPFVDIGGFVIEYLQEKWPDKSIMDLIKEIAHIYVNNWDNNLHLFFLNSTITHNSNKGQKGIEKTLAYYNGLIEEKNAMDGFCRITGQKGKVFSAGRDNHIMSGSGTLINFHHGFESGIMLSKEALIRMLFVPLGVEQLGDKVAIVFSNSQDINRYFVKKYLEQNLKDISAGISKSILKSDFSNPANALFDYANQCIENIKSATVDKETGKSNTKGVILNLFHFTNFGAKPTIDLYALPATVFSFNAACMLYYKNEWLNFVYHYYSNSKFKNTEYDANLNCRIDSKEMADYQIYKTWRNKIFDYLLNDKSLLSLFLQHGKCYLFNFEIVELYQINIKNMNRKTLDKIKELANFIVDNRSDDEIKKSMTRLNGAKNISDLRGFFIRLLDKNYNERKSEPLFSLDEYVEYLFPDGCYWSEIRDLLLIAIYQKLHETDKRVALELTEDE